MNILIIGSGGREHALADSYAKSKQVATVFVAPGNDLMTISSSKIKTLAVDTFSFKTILQTVKKHHINLVDVAPDEHLAKGLVDYLKENGVEAFGPSQKASELEWSKEWSRDFMARYNLPTPAFASFTDYKEAASYLKSLPKDIPLFVKASGLASGKGAIKANTTKDALEAIKDMGKFGEAGETFLIEECMVGEEFSMFILSDGKHYQIIQTAQDHKNVYNGMRGPNTGGMGCVSPTTALTPSLRKDIEKTIIEPLIAGLLKENRPFTGIIYFGGMVTEQGVKIVEFNARWGDPEAEVILPSITTDYLVLVQATLNQSLDTVKIKTDGKARVSVVGCARGYPEDYSQVVGKKIYGLDTVRKMSGIKLYGAGIKKQKHSYVVNGGRIFHLVAEGKTVVEARKKAYAAMSHIYIEGNNLHYRTDIGWRELERNI